MMTDEECWALNVRVARGVFGLQVVSERWPCYWTHDAREWQPCVSVLLVDGQWEYARPPEESEHRMYQPVYVPESFARRRWPPRTKAWEPESPELYACVRAVPYYAGDSRDCDQVEAWLCERRVLTIESPDNTYGPEPWYVHVRSLDYSNKSSSSGTDRREAMCRAALAVAEQEAHDA